ncbi:MAG: putative sulfate exporter family transporter [Desulfomonile sp.]
MAEKGTGWSSLWNTEDWVAVWIGFFVIIVILAGLTIKIPGFKWVTEGEFTSFVNQTSPAVDKIAKEAEQKGETDLIAKAESLKVAINKGDRKGIADAAKNFEDASKKVKDAGLKKKAGQVGKEIKDNASNTLTKVFSSTNIGWSLYIGLGILVLSLIAMSLLGARVGKFLVGFPVVFLIAWFSQFIAGNFTINYYGIEYVLWCLALGLFVSNVIGVPQWLTEAVRTEFYIKTGLVILGSGILFKEILEAGFLGIIQAVLVVSVIWYACYWIAMKLKVDEEFAVILSSAVSICGVSAAIATSGAIKGDPKKLSYTTSIVLICAVPMLVLQPLFAKWVGMPDAVAGAWLGGTLDTSGSVVAAGALISEAAMKVGVIVKMSQNVLIGVAAFILAVVWTMKKVEEVPGAGKPGAIEIWNRFPKFVLGFIVASLIFSFLLDPKTVSEVKSSLGGIRTMWFALAFTSIGLETKFTELSKLGGGRPALAFLIAQGLNIIWTLILAYIFFGGWIFEAPKF